jgi:hypothetical protein
MTHVIAQHGRVRIVRGVWLAQIQTFNANEEWVDYGAMAHDSCQQFEQDFSAEMNDALEQCWTAWLDALDSECSTVAADAMAAKDDVLPA